MRTLHDVPPADLRPALQEARRVLRPSGIVCVAEPFAGFGGAIADDIVFTIPEHRVGSVGTL